MKGVTKIPLRHCPISWVFLLGSYAQCRFVRNHRFEKQRVTFSARVALSLRSQATPLGRGAPEMFVFSNPIAPWQPADSIAIIKLLSVQLSAHLENEVLYARTSLALDDEARLVDIMPLDPGTGMKFAIRAPSLAGFQRVFPSPLWRARSPAFVM